jgi:redox-sensitive bicupin YhaK (pirin superfamily)
MHSVRKIKTVLQGKPTLEGAGVHLKRAFGFAQAPGLDPFLLLDDFSSDNPDDYLPGFPWHPHRGIETITYILEGEVEHGDSIGNRGVIGQGDVQWMTAGSGIIHQEMPLAKGNGRLQGFQLWANLPASHKMMEPRYRDIKKDQIPEITTDEEVRVKVICGGFGKIKGPAQDIVIDPEYLDVTVPPKSSFRHPTDPDRTVFAYVIEGSGSFEPQGHSIDPEAEGGNDIKSIRNLLIGKNNLVVFGPGSEVLVSAGDDGVCFLLISGKPLGEPVAWGGPIVMNTKEELKIAFEEYEKGTFLKHKKPS